MGPLTFLIVALAAKVLLAPPALRESFERAARTVADVTRATSVVAMSGANITIAVSVVAVSAVQGASSAAAEAWNGVDGLNVAISARAARLYTHVSVDAKDT